MSGSFQVSTGGFLDVDVAVTGPDDRVVYSVQRETEGRFTFISQTAGTYKLCFSNKMSTVSISRAFDRRICLILSLEVA